MNNRIFKYLGSILVFCVLLFMLLYIQMFYIMYHIEITEVTDGGVMLTIFGQDFVYEYNV